MNLKVKLITSNIYHKKIKLKLIKFPGFLQPLQTAESSVLVDVLHLPERLFPIGSELRDRCENGGVCSK